MHDSASTYKVYVTDNYESPITTIPRERDLGQRVKVFAVRVEDGAVRAMHVRSFGDTTSAGAIRVTESLAVDSAYGRLLIAEELETDSHIKIYDLDGRFTGRVLGRGLFPQQAEGIALYACGAMGGYWIATDQGDNTNTFVVFDRATLEVVGRVTGRTTRRTDGIAVTEQGYGPFRKGALYAAHVDAGIGALSWEAIEATLRGGKAGCDA
jgi:3-phytase